MSDLTTDDPPAEATGVAGNQVSKLPWVILLILLGSTTINYIDRITLSVLAPTLRDEFGMSNTQYAWVLNAFQFSYLIMYSVGGRLADLLGVRRALSLFVVWWSVASVLHAFSVGAKSLAAFRFVLAMGEGGNWPTVMKAAAERVPGAMRSFAVGVGQQRQQPGVYAGASTCRMVGRNVGLETRIHRHRPDWLPVAALLDFRNTPKPAVGTANRRKTSAMGQSGPFPSGVGCLPRPNDGGWSLGLLHFLAPRILEPASAA